MEIDEVSVEAAGYAFGLRTYQPIAPAGPVLVWIHGGAFMFGDLDMPEADHVARALCERGILVVSVDYTLAPLDALPELPPSDGAGPEFPPPPLSSAPRARFPVASLQIVAAFDWAIANAARLGSDPSRVCLGGASAGANLAASGGMRLRDREGPKPTSVALVYPVLHRDIPAIDDQLAALLAPVPAFLTFPPTSTAAINRNYAGDSIDDPYAFPAGHNVRGLAPTLIVNAEADRLRASGEAFAADLALAGVDTTVVRERGTYHGFLNEVGSDGANRTIERLRVWLLSR